MALRSVPSEACLRGAVHPAAVHSPIFQGPFNQTEEAAMTTHRCVRWTLSAALALAALTSPAHASQIPPGCSTDGVGLDLQKSATTIHNGDTVTYTVTLDNSGAPGVCDAAAVLIRGFCPDPSGQPTILVKQFAVIADLPHASPLSTVGTFDCGINLGNGVTTAIARATLAAVLHDNPIADDLLAFQKDLSVLLAVTPPPPPPPPVSQIPTLSEASLLGLGIFIVAVGALTIRKRRRPV
jgi:hypothetical protein